MNINFDLNHLEQVGQVRPSDTNPAALVSPRDFEKIIVTTIIVTNVDASAHDFRIFHDDDGTTYDQTTALVYDDNLAANAYIVLDFERGLAVLDDGNIAVRSDGASDLTFTAYGIRIPRRAGA